MSRDVQEKPQAENIAYHLQQEKEQTNQHIPLRKHAYSNVLKILPPKNEKFQIKNSDIFHFSAQSIDCGCSLEPPQSIDCGCSLEPPRWGGSNEHPQSMLLSRNKKNNVYPSKPQFYCIKVGFKGVKYIDMFSWWVHKPQNKVKQKNELPLPQQSDYNVRQDPFNTTIK